MRRFPLILITSLFTVCLVWFSASAGFFEGLGFMTLGTSRYVAFSDVASFYGLKRRVMDEVVRLWRDDVEMEFQKDSRRAEVNGRLIWLNTPVEMLERHWGMGEPDLRSIVDPLLRPDQNLTSVGYHIVVLDPGHGGEDGGGVGPTGLTEGEVVLDIARRTKTLLANAGVIVFMTRTDDYGIPLEYRPKKAANWAADVLVSIHANAADNTMAGGLETYILPAPGCLSTSGGTGGGNGDSAYAGNRFDGPNFLLGYHLHSNLMKQYPEADDRGVRQARFMVLRDAPCPAALVECGFISNAEEEVMLRSDAYRDRMARGVANGILNYLREVKRIQLGV